MLMAQRLRDRESKILELGMAQTTAGPRGRMTIKWRRRAPSRSLERKHPAITQHTGSSDGNSNGGITAELLTEVWTARLAYFQSYTIAHPRLVEAKQKLMSAIQESSRNSLVMILGPTGVGKTTLRVKTEQILTEGALSELEADRARIPVVSVEAIAPEYGNFNWRDQFKRILIQMREPLVGYKCPSAGRRNEESEFYASLASKASAAAYRYAVEQALRHRQPFAVLIDEAQHMAKVTSGRRLLDQLDVINPSLI